MPASEIHEIYNELCQQFGIHPNLKIDSELKNDDGAFFHCPDEFKEYGEIVLSPRPEHGIRMVLTHEFAHAVDYSRNGYRRKHHDKRFYKILLEVIDVTYSTPKRYVWSNEYKRIQTWAAKDGFYTPKEI